MPLFSRFTMQSSTTLWQVFLVDIAEECGEIDLRELS